MKNIFKLFVLTIMIFTTMQSCESYEDYVEDYDYISVYFGTQRPLRTIVARENMSFKLGVALAGKRENNATETTTFTIDPSLLSSVENADKFTLMPKDYYSMDLSESDGDSAFVIFPGSFIGDIVINLNKDKFTSDPLSIDATYAIPVRLLETTVDTILSGNAVTPAKDYTILVVKYIAPEHAAYYGSGYETDEKGSVNHYAFNAASPKRMTTSAKNELILNALGSLSADSNASNKLKVVISEDKKSVSLSSVDGGKTVTDIKSTYDNEKKVFTLNYSYVNSDQKTVVVEEELVLRGIPEEELRFEEW